MSLASLITRSASSLTPHLAVSREVYPSIYYHPGTGKSLRLCILLLLCFPFILSRNLDEVFTYNHIWL